jgi:hypothetical protein
MYIVRKDGSFGQRLAEYSKYLDSVRDKFPKGVLDLATAPWRYNHEDHRELRDSSVQQVQINEVHCGPRQEVRRIEIVVLLFGAYHDGYSELRYQDIEAYCLN